MTSTDRAFITAFRRDSQPATAVPARSPATPHVGSLPGTGVEVVSFGSTIPAPHVARPSARRQSIAGNEVAPNLPAATPKRTLHPPHPPVAPSANSRRPLSTLIAASDQNEEFEPETVVPRLRWPVICTQLATEHAGRLGGVLEALGQLSGKETKIVGVVGANVGAGCTTLTLALARQAARLGRRIAVVEADAALPALRDQFALTTSRGLCDMLAGQATLPQVAVAAHDDRVTLLPWGTSPAIAIDARQRFQLSLSASRLRFAFDLILADLGTPNSTNRHAIELFAAMHGNAVLMVASQISPPSRILELERQLEAGGCPVLGIIQNGAPLTTDH